MKEKSVKNEYEKAIDDLETVLKTTEEMIDVPFGEFSEFVAKQNRGTLSSIRVLLFSKLDEADKMAGEFIAISDDKEISKEDLIRIGSVFTIVSKIIERIGYVDTLIAERKSLTEVKK